MRFATICSGIGAPEVAWHRLGWQPQFVSEIAAFPSAVLKYRFPHVHNLGDMTKYKDWIDHAIDILCSGTPCQAFSVAGLRKGLDDPRGNLTLTLLGFVEKFRPRWLVWENVPGVLSEKTGAFGAFLSGLAKLGYGFAYRILDAQYFGVPQRRRRVFVVAHIGGQWQRAAAVLFERHSLQGHPAPGRETGKAGKVAPSLSRSAGCSGANDFNTSGGLVAPTLPSRSKAGGGMGTDFDCDGGLVVPSLTCNGDAHSGFRDEHGLIAHSLRAQSQCAHAADLETYVTHSLRGEGFDASEDGTGRGVPLVPMLSRCDTAGEGSRQDYETTTIVPVALAMRQREGCAGGGKGPLLSEEKSLTLAANTNDQVLFKGSSVRRLTPRGCERLQGFPDDWTRIPGLKTWRDLDDGETPDGLASIGLKVRKTKKGKWRVNDPDGPRYKALGNSMAVPVMEWIGRRIQLLEEICPL